MTALEKYQFNRHVWDVEPAQFPLQRHIIFATYILFSLASGLIKISVLLFCRRLFTVTMSNTVKWLFRISLTLMIVYTIGYSMVPPLACHPMSDFWEQSDPVKILKGYKPHCYNEGADVVSNGVLSTVQDFVTALLPTILCWNLQTSLRERIAIYSLFAFSYTTVLVSALRTWNCYRIFYTTFDISWLVSENWTYVLLELHIGCICASAPALKVFFKQFLHSEKRPSPNSSNQTQESRSSSFMSRLFGRSSAAKVAPWERLHFWRSYHATTTRNGYLSDRHSHVSTDKHGGIVQAHEHFLNLQGCEQDVEMQLSPPVKAGGVSHCEDEVDAISTPVVASPEQSLQQPLRSHPARPWGGC